MVNGVNYAALTDFPAEVFHVPSPEYFDIPFSKCLAHNPASEKNRRVLPYHMRKNHVRAVVFMVITDSYMYSGLLPIDSIGKSYLYDESGEAEGINEDWYSRFEERISTGTSNTETQQPPNRLSLSMCQERASQSLPLKFKSALAYVYGVVIYFPPEDFLPDGGGEMNRLKLFVDRLRKSLASQLGIDPEHPVFKMIPYGEFDMDELCRGDEDDHYAVFNIIPGVFPTVELYEGGRTSSNGPTLDIPLRWSCQEDI